MRRLKIKYFSLSVFFLVNSISFAQNHAKIFDELTSNDLKVINNDILRGHTLKNYLDSLITLSWDNWKKDFELRKLPEDQQKHYRELKKKFIEAIGGLPERTPLNTKVTGTVSRESYRVEKILFQSMPDFYVTGDLFLPLSDKFKAPYPAVLIPCGHYQDSKAHDEYQSMAALCALNGMAAFVYDPIDQGERLQFRTDKANTTTWGTHAHNLNGIREILLGRNIARFEIWDGMRAVDYLQSRNDINPELIGVTGNSGGGTQTSYLMALDERIKVSAPSCYLHNLNSQTKNSMGDAEQQIFGQLKFGMDHPDYVLMNAPRPVKILAATNDFFRIDAVWETFRFLKRYYTNIGYSENVDILENDAGHNYNKTQREGAVRWLVRYLLGKDEVIFEPKIELFSQEELNSSPAGRVLQIKKAKSILDLQNEELLKENKQRKEFLKSNNIETVRQQIQKLINCKSYEEIAPPEAIIKNQIATDKCTIQKIILEIDDGIYFPALLFIPNKNISSEKLLYLSEDGKSFHLKEIERLISRGITVLSVDLPGNGEAKQKDGDKLSLSKNLPSDDCFDAYLLGKSIIGIRTEEILACSKYLLKSGDPSSVIKLIADGELGVPSLHAAFLASEIFADVKISNSLESWENVIKSEKSFGQLVNVVNSALKYYDLPDLVKLLGKKVTIENPTDARGLNPNNINKSESFSNAPEYNGLAGIWYGNINLKNPEGPDPIDSLDLSWSNKIEKRGRDWSAEWFGFITSPFEGDVTFHASTNQNLDLFIDSEPVISVKSGKENAQGAVKLLKNKNYQVRIVFNQDGVDSSYAKIKWSWTGHPETVINQKNLFYSSQQKYMIDTVWR